MKDKAAAMLEMDRVPTATDAGLGAKFSKMVERRQTLKALIADAEAELGDKSKGIRGLNWEIEDMIEEAGITAVTCADWTVTRCNGQSVTLSRENMQTGLLEYGVPADDVTELVEAATKRKEYTYIQVAKSKVLTERAERLGFEVKSKPIPAKKGKGKRR